MRPSTAPWATQAAYRSSKSSRTLRRLSTPASSERASACTSTPSVRTFGSLPRQASSRQDARHAPAQAAHASSTKPRPRRSTHPPPPAIACSLAGSERDPSARAEEAGRAWGAHLVDRPPPFTSISKQKTIDQVVRLHEEHGFSPELRRAPSGQEIVLKHCPFHEAATTYPTVICSLHLGLVRGALAELGTGVEADWLKPFAEPGACVAHITDT